MRNNNFEEFFSQILQILRGDVPPISNHITLKELTCKEFLKDFFVLREQDPDVFKVDHSKWAALILNNDYGVLVLHRFECNVMLKDGELKKLPHSQWKDALIEIAIESMTQTFH